LIGPLEIAIVVVLLLVVFFHQRIPALARTAAERIRGVKDSAQVGERVDRLQKSVGDKVDPQAIAKSAGRGMREARDLRDAVTAVGDSEPAPKPAAATAEKPDAKPHA
jgi:Sec-independent protein translocase protein TatA